MNVCDDVFLKLFEKKIYSGRYNQFSGRIYFILDQKINFYITLFYVICNNKQKKINFKNINYLFGLLYGIKYFWIIQ